MKVYRCDRCKKDITARHIVSMKVAKSDDILRWDVCRACVDDVLTATGLNDDTGRKMKMTDGPDD